MYFILFKEAKDYLNVYMAIAHILGTERIVICILNPQKK